MLKCPRLYCDVVTREYKIASSWMHWASYDHLLGHSYSDAQSAIWIQLIISFYQDILQLSQNYTYQRTRRLFYAHTNEHLVLKSYWYKPYTTSQTSKLIFVHDAIVISIRKPSCCQQCATLLMRNCISHWLLTINPNFIFPHICKYHHILQNFCRQIT